MSKKLNDLFELLKTAMLIAAVPCRASRVENPPAVDRLNTKADLLQSLNDEFLRDVSEAFFAERHKAIFGATAMTLVRENGQQSCSFVLTGARIHPSTRLAPDKQPHSPMVFDIWGETHAPGKALHGVEVYFEVDETKGDVLLLSPTST